MPGEARSADGTTIRWIEDGSGPPLLLVPGGPGGEHAFDPLVEHLNGELRCITMGRRGKRFSDDGPAYAYEREYEDIAAVLDEIGPPQNVFAHSSGAICALGAALGGSIDKLVLVEPPLPVDGPVIDDATIAAAQEALDRGDDEEALLIGLRQAVKHDPSIVEARRARPDWPDAVRRAPGWLRELPEINRLPRGAERYGAIESPTLLIYGSTTAEHHLRAIAALAEALPHAETVVFEGYGHDVPTAAARDVAAAVLEFLRA